METWINQHNQHNQHELMVTYMIHIMKKPWRLHGNLPIVWCRPETNVTARSAQSWISQPRASQLKGTPSLALLGTFFRHPEGSKTPKLEIDSVFDVFFHFFFHVGLGFQWIWGFSVWWECMRNLWKPHIGSNKQWQTLIEIAGLSPKIRGLNGNVMLKQKRF